MTDLASALTNDTSAIQADVQEIYAFEKNISQVIEFIKLFDILSFVFLLVSLECCRTTCSR